MEKLIKHVQSICVVKRKPVLDYDLQPFLNKKLPVFWVMGSPGCGKSTLAEMLAKSSNYRLVTINNLLSEEIAKGRLYSKVILECASSDQEVPSGIVVNLIKEEVVRTCENAIGYIIDGFPQRSDQAKLFEKQICKVSLIIYVTLILDAMLARKVTQIGPFDPNEERIRFVRNTKRLNDIARKYDQKTIKVTANYPPEDTCTRLVENLEDFWGYKFLRLYNKNQ